VSDMLTRPMAQKDAHAVGELLRAGFSSELQQYIIYCQLGVEEYLSVVISWPRAFPAHRLYVAENSGGRIVGFSEFRTISSSTCLLSYICVADDARGAGLAEQMLITHLDLCPEFDTVQLDVFSHNVAALRLYTRLGFIQTGTKRWWQRALPEPVTAGVSPLEIADLHVFQAASGKYGFGMIRCTYEGETSDVGLTSPTVIRAGTLDVYGNDDLLGQLRGFLPQTQQVLFIDQGESHTPADSQIVLESHRLEANTKTIKVARR
jgi:ribosomal protein S18 acetylase RimI-like enzyme